jgi:predicted RNase H-like HicB family nuclease
MKYTVMIEESDEGFAVSVPGLPGCHSQGATREEALTNITDAIREYLEVVRELAISSGARPAEVEVQPCQGCRGSITSMLFAHFERSAFGSLGKTNTSS